MVAEAEAGSSPIVIFRSVNRDGETYALDPRSLDRLRDKLGTEAHVRTRIFLAHETSADYQDAHGPIAAQVIQLLTGVTEDRLASIGGVVFRDPITDQTLPRA
jgi:hypothetical protein